MTRLAMADLAAVTAGEVSRFGGKATGLGALIAARARVPEGFAVEATAAEPPDWSAETRQEFLRRAAALLAGGPIAVRSSAKGEDAAERSFAGMYTTVLDVASAEAALEAASRCIASGRSELVAAYHRLIGDGESASAVGLVCQRMVPARAAGVCFTVDPLGRDGAVVVEAVAGAGESLVSGQRTPERWRVYRTGRGTWVAHREPDGGGRGAASGASEGPGRSPGSVPIRSPASGERALEPEQAITVARESVELAARRGVPLDLEWALDAAASVWWLQARPITAAIPVRPYRVDRACPDAAEGPVTFWANYNLRETMPDPLSPLAATMWREAVPAILAEIFYGRSWPLALTSHFRVVDLVEGRPYWNLNCTLALFGPRGAWIWAHMFDEQAAIVIRRLVESGEITARPLPVPFHRLMHAWLKQFVKGAGFVLAALRPGRARIGLRAYGQRMARLRDRNLAGVSDTALMREFRQLSVEDLMPIAASASAAALGVLAFAMGHRFFAPCPEAHRLLGMGLVDNPTTQVAVDLDALAEAARPIAADFLETAGQAAAVARLEAHAAGRAWLAQLSRFLELNGQRCPREFDLTVPRWAEDASMIFELVRSWLRTPPGESVGDRLLRLNRERRVAIDQAIRAAPWWRRPLLRAIDRAVEAYLPLREAPKHEVLRTMLEARRLALEMADRLVARGVLAHRDQVFLLDLLELEALAADRSLPGPGAPGLVRRRELLEEQRRREPPAYLRSDGVPVVVARVARPAVPGVHVGTPASGGTATGPVRILASPDPSALAPGDVLVVHVADPGWTPLFPRAAAVVMEVGGLMCHAAVVARELGVPTVVSLDSATRLFSEGQIVTVDGDAGTVTSRSDAPRPPQGGTNIAAEGRTSADGEGVGAMPMN